MRQERKMRDLQGISRAEQEIYKVGQQSCYFDLCGVAGHVSVIPQMCGVLCGAVNGLDDDVAVAIPGGIHRLDIQVRERRQEGARHARRQFHVQQVPQVKLHIQLCIGRATGHLRDHGAIALEVPRFYGTGHRDGRGPGRLRCWALGNRTHAQPALVVIGGDQDAKIAHLIQTRHKNLSQAELGIQGQSELRHV